MTFLHPWAIWIGVAALGLPVAIHLLTRPRPTRMALSTLRFLREAIRQRRARHRLRDAIVLALRTAALILLALAIARPQFGQQPLVSDRTAGEAVRVVILDASQSMAATERGIRAIERARTAAAGYLRYRPGLAANLIVAGASPHAVFDGPSTNFDALRDELARTEPLPERMDVRRALAAAGKMLAPASDDDHRRRELVVVSDFQASCWSSADFSPLPEAAKIQLESVAPASPPANLAILRAECQSRGSEGHGVELAVNVGNYTGTPQKVTVEVTLGESTYRLTGPCPAGRSTTLSEAIQLRQDGWQSGEARLVGVDDALAADNVRPLVARVRTRPVYALVTRQLAAERPSSSHFLECALVPDGRLKDTAAAVLLRIDPAAVDAQALSSADLVCLDHPGKLAPETINLLAGLMRRGRAVFYVAGEPIDATNLKRLADAAGAGLAMPVEFAPPPEGYFRRDLFLAAVRSDQPPFAVFGDGLDALRGQLRFAGGLSSRRRDGGVEQDVLATYGDGTACLVVAAADAGALAVLNADLAASNLARSPAFVPLVDELVQRLLGRNRARDAAVCGEPVVVNLPGEIASRAGLVLAGPDGGPAVGSDQLGELVDEGAGVVWRWTNPGRPGVYSVQRGGTTLFAMAVQIPPEESQLESLSPEVLKTRLAAGRDVYCRNAATPGDRRDDAWTWFLVACVTCLLGEVLALLAFRT